MAVVTNTRSPQTMGLECPRPGIGVFQRTPFADSTFQLAGVEKPSATPLAAGPRNDGQFPIAASSGNAGAIDNV